MANRKFTTFMAIIAITIATVIAVITAYYLERYESIQQHSKSILVEQAVNQLTFN